LYVLLSSLNILTIILLTSETEDLFPSLSTKSSMVWLLTFWGVLFLCLLCFPSFYFLICSCVVRQLLGVLITCHLSLYLIFML
jgi:hypothetical protein